MSIKSILIITIVAATAFAIGYFLGAHTKTYKSYEDCLLGEIEKAKTQVGTQRISFACGVKYPKSNPFDKFDER